MTINEPKLSLIYLESIAWRLVVCDLNFRSDCDFMEIQSALARKLYKIPKNKTVTFKDCILGIYGSNINYFQELQHAFPLRWFNPTFECPWRAVNVPSNSSLFLTEITWDENYPYILIKQGPCYAFDRTRLFWTWWNFGLARSQIRQNYFQRFISKEKRISNQRVRKANLWIIKLLYVRNTILLLNEPAISLPVYFKSVKKWKFVLRKKTKQNKKNDKKCAQRRESNPGPPTWRVDTLGTLRSRTRRL